MATLVGHIGPFVEGQEEWPQYAERVEHFFKANGIDGDEKRLAAFMSLIGPQVYKLLANLVAPKKPGEKKYEEVVAELKKHYDLQPSEIMQRFRFHTRIRKTEESIGTYLAELKALAQKCNFKSDTLNEMLRDRLVCGINEDSIQKRLLSVADLTYDSAVKKSLAMEAAMQNAKEMQARKDEVNVGDEQVHAVQQRPSRSHERSSPQRECFRCGNTNHTPDRCRFKDARCFSCGKIGHIGRVCRSRKGRTVQTVRDQVVEEEGLRSEATEYHLHALSTQQSSDPITVEVSINGEQVHMEVDTGAAVSLVSDVVCKQLWPSLALQQTPVKLKTYSGAPLEVKGRAQVEVRYQGQEASLPLLVVAGEGPSLLGRDWLTQLRLDWKSICNIRIKALEEVLSKHEKVFQDGLGTLEGYKATLHVDPNASPKFCKARTVPYAMQELVEKELDRLVDEGILEPIQFAEWAAPIVPVLKSDKKTVRICGDFSQTVNKAAKVDAYPIPKIRDLFAKVAGAKKFSILDLSQAYQQVQLNEQSRKYVVINTHRGLFQYNRLPYGIASAPGIFQRVMESLLRNIPGVVVYIDDILITGKDEEKHLATLEKVLDRLETAGLRLQRKKCHYLMSSVQYLGHRIDAHGLHPTEEKLRAIKEAPEPNNVGELKAFLGMLSYYSNFIPNMATALHPLYQLLKQNAKWKWTAVEQATFQKAKDLLLSSQVLVHYDPDQEIVLACDASESGIGAVLSHRQPDGTDKPIGFVSRTLTDTEKRYSQLEKEGLACVFGVTRFHAYIYGRSFTLITDHKPLQGLLGQNRAISPQAAGRIQRWALKLANYHYTLEFRPTHKHANADALSRLPLPEKPACVPVPAEMVLLTEMLQSAPITAAQIARWTRTDPVLSKVLRCIKEGWPEQADDALKPYWQRRLELSVMDDCILWGNRVLIPKQGRPLILDELHGGHPGASKMKALARMFVWWIKMDSDIEQLVKQCPQCQQSQQNPPAAPLHPWQWPLRPWTRIHIDFAGPVQGKMLLIAVDAHSKWIEAQPMTTTTAKATIEQLRVMFARWGIPETIVSDNGPQFVSHEYEDFCRLNGTRRVLVAPYHPSSNGLAERAVKTVKQGIAKLTEGSLQDKISRFLYSYRLTPHTTTERPPAELMIGRQLRSRLDLVKPQLEKRVQEKQQKQKETHDNHAKWRSFKEGEEVFAKNYSGTGDKWLSGKIVQVTGPVSAVIELSNGTRVKKHFDQIRKRETSETQFAHDYSGNDSVEPPADFELESDIDSGESETEHDLPAEEIMEPPRRSYPSRARRPPIRLDPTY